MPGLPEKGSKSGVMYGGGFHPYAADKGFYGAVRTMKDENI